MFTHDSLHAAMFPFPPTRRTSLFLATVKDLVAWNKFTTCNRTFDAFAFLFLNYSLTWLTRPTSRGALA